MASFRDRLLTTSLGRWVTGTGVGLALFGTMNGSSTQIASAEPPAPADNSIFLSVDDHNGLYENYKADSLAGVLDLAKQAVASPGKPQHGLSLDFGPNVTTHDIAQIAKTFAGHTSQLDIKLSTDILPDAAQKKVISDAAAHISGGVEVYNDRQDVKFLSDSSSPLPAGHPSLTIETDVRGSDGRSIIINNVPVNNTAPVTAFNNLLNGNVDQVSITGENAPIPTDIAKQLPGAFANIIKDAGTVQLNNVQDDGILTKNPLYGVTTQVNGENLENQTLESDPKNLKISLVSKERDKVFTNGSHISDYQLGNKSDELTLGSIPTEVQLDASTPHQAITDIRSAVQKQIDTEGYIPTLMITGDGSPNSIALPVPTQNRQLPLCRNLNLPLLTEKSCLSQIPGVEQYFEDVSVLSILQSLEKFQQGEKHIGEIKFTSCDLASQLDKKTAMAFSEESKRLGVPITLATTTDDFSGKAPGAAHYVTFEPNGHVTIPAMSNPDGYQVVCTITNTCENITKNEAWMKNFKIDPSSEQKEASAPSAPPAGHQRFKVTDAGEMTGNFSTPGGAKVSVSGTSHRM